MLAQTIELVLVCGPWAVECEPGSSGRETAADRRVGSVRSQPARQIHDDKCEEGGDCIVVVYFHGSSTSFRRL